MRCTAGGDDYRRDRLSPVRTRAPLSEFLRPVVFRRNSCISLEVFPKEGLRREVQFVAYLLNRQIRRCQEGLRFVDNVLFDPLDGGFPARFGYHLGQILGTQTQNVRIVV